VEVSERALNCFARPSFAALTLRAGNLAREACCQFAYRDDHSDDLTLGRVWISQSQNPEASCLAPSYQSGQAGAATSTTAAAEISSVSRLNQRSTSTASAVANPTRPRSGREGARN